MSLTYDQKRRYARNIALSGVGEAGQARLLAARVLVVGAGGLGSPVILYLAAAGIGTLGIADFDRVELSNLQRQILHENADIGRLKAQSARDRVEELNPDVKVALHTEKLTPANLAAIVSGYDIVADGSDNFATRFAVADACALGALPLVTAAVRTFDGQLAVFKPYLENDQPCYHCLVSASPEDERGCNDAGVLGALTGTLGSLQALQVIKELLSIGESMAGRMLHFDGASLKTRISHITRDPSCPYCAGKHSAL